MLNFMQNKVFSVYSLCDGVETVSCEIVPLPVLVPIFMPSRLCRNGYIINRKYFHLHNIQHIESRRGYLGSTLLACRAVVRPHIKLEICLKSFSVE